MSLPPHNSSDFPSVTAVNCSVGRPLGDPDLDRARQLGVDRIELWWPWTTAEPEAAEIDDLVAELQRRNLSLVALNFWGGDTSAGERGVLHKNALSQRHLDAHARLAEQTGAEMFNLLVGRGGRAFSAEQCDRIRQVADLVTERGLGTVLLEPSRSPGEGDTDYPLQTVRDAENIISAVPGTALLADFWHLAETEGAEGAGGIRGWLGRIADPADSADPAGCPTSGAWPAHVQIADDPGRGAPGTGHLPIKEWVHRLRSAGYTGDVAGEWVW